MSWTENGKYMLKAPLIPTLSLKHGLPLWFRHPLRNHSMSQMQEEEGCMHHGLKTLA